MDVAATPPDALLADRPEPRAHPAVAAGRRRVRHVLGVAMVSAAPEPASAATDVPEIECWTIKSYACEWGGSECLITSNRH
ncbi:hypothetical protein HII36_25285 [Nonomuraea sp. NN258]|uniref:hypothetical protein n=1 Tax=Nonomuraea antri TaxID=2730852 RepID=UPI0015692FE1|nr:hypothetical protein [Nonomuraea antri]NRQ35113.1 hypothetical protein [Nonomuraea antri]